MTSRDPAHDEPVLDAALRALADDDRRVEAPADLYDAVMARWDEERAAVPRRRWPFDRAVRRAAWGRGGRRAGAPSAATALGWLQADRSDSSGVWMRRAAMVAAVLIVAWMVGRSLPGSPAVHETTSPPRVAAVNVIEPPAGEALHMVKVRMPRTALRAFGVALVDPEATGEVEVDVVVGEDGFPRSIRRVQRLPAGHRQE